MARYLCALVLLVKHPAQTPLPAFPRSSTVRHRSMNVGLRETLRSAQVRRISWVRGVGRSARFRSGLLRTCADRPPCFFLLLSRAPQEAVGWTDLSGGKVSPPEPRLGLRARPRRARPSARICNRKFIVEAANDAARWASSLRTCSPKTKRAAEAALLSQVRESLT